jgi:hypothetical protein
MAVYRGGVRSRTPPAVGGERAACPVCPPARFILWYTHGIRMVKRSIPRIKTFAIHLVYAVAGLAALDLLSLLQKIFIGAPLGIAGFIVPSIYGAITGEIIGLWAERLRRRNRALQSHLLERRFLLRDLHHRTQNNLQIVSSLLNLERADGGDVQRSLDRIDLLAAIYRILYETDADYTVALDEFLPAYAAEVCRNWCPCAAEENVSADHIVVSLDTAVVLGMIVNEVISELDDALCADGGTPTFTLSMEEPRRCRLAVTVPFAVNPTHCEHLGSAGEFRADLITMIGSQIAAAVTVDLTDQFAFTITFDPHAQRVDPAVRTETDTILGRRDRTRSRGAPT